jgi:hypothetical protein
MKCARCSNDVQDTAIACPHCGTNTVQDQQAQQHSTKRFSYLPPGTPPWPTIIGEHKYNRETGTHTGFADNHPVAISSPLTRTHKNTGFLKMLSILILMPIIGSLVTLGLLYAQGQFRPGSSSNIASVHHVDNNTTTSSDNADPGVPQGAATPQATSTATVTQTTSQPGSVATLPATTNFKAYTNKDINMSLRYPSDWSVGQVTQGNNTAATLPIQPPQNYGMQMYVEHLTNAFSTFFNDAGELNRRNTQSLFQLQGAHDIQKIASPGAAPTIADTRWEQSDTTLQVGTSPKLHFTTISVQHNGSYYSTYFLMPDSMYQDALQKYIQPLLASMKFLS